MGQTPIRDQLAIIDCVSLIESFNSICLKFFFFSNGKIVLNDYY